MNKFHKFPLEIYKGLIYDTVYTIYVDRLEIFFTLDLFRFYNRKLFIQSSELLHLEFRMSCNSYDKLGLRRLMLSL